jgi:hypothetical protein
MPDDAEMTLGDKQRLFARLVASLLAQIYEQGYECTLDWAYRPPEIAACLADHQGCPNCHARHGAIAARNSLHSQRLAIDLNLFRNGQFLGTVEDHRPLGEWWEAQHELCRWGGRFGDGDHYSVTHGGMS